MVESSWPENPVPIVGGASNATSRFASATPAVDVDDGVVERLRSACASVVIDAGACAEASRDWWPLALVWATNGEVPAIASAVVTPASVEEVAAVLRICSEARVPVTPSAGRSGVCGASVPVHGGVVLDLRGLEGIVGVDDESLLVDVRAGTYGDAFEETLRRHHGLTAGHWPQSMALSTVGGWIACRSAGQYSTRYGKVEDMVVGLEVVLADGTVVRTGGRAPRAAVGPDLTQLFVGSEGTLGVVTEVQLRGHPVPPEERRAAYGFATFAAGLDACRRILRRGATPAVLRLYDEIESKRGFDIDGANLLIVLDEGDGGVVDASMAIVAAECEASDASVLDTGLVGRWLEHRNDVDALGALVQRGFVLDTTEIAARWSALTPIYDEVIARVGALPGNLAVSAHQSHAYVDGACLYFTFAGRPGEQAEGSVDRAAQDEYYRAAWDAVSQATLAHGGALSHHHGIGVNRARFMADALGPAIAVLGAVKDALDPHGILNPGKLGLASAFGPSPWP